MPLEFEDMGAWALYKTLGRASRSALGRYRRRYRSVLGPDDLLAELIVTAENDAREAADGYDENLRCDDSRHK